MGIHGQASLSQNFCQKPQDFRTLGQTQDRLSRIWRWAGYSPSQIIMFSCNGMSDQTSWNEVSYYWDTNSHVINIAMFCQALAQAKILQFIICSNQIMYWVVLHLIRTAPVVTMDEDWPVLDWNTGQSSSMATAGAILRWRTTQYIIWLLQIMICSIFWQDVVKNNGNCNLGHIVAFYVMSEIST